MSSRGRNGAAHVAGQLRSGVFQDTADTKVLPGLDAAVPDLYVEPTSRPVLGRDLERSVKLPQANLPSLQLGTRPSEAAAVLRRYWGLPDGPVKHLVATVESRGIGVAVRPLHELDAVDAFSTLIVGRPIVITTPCRS